MSHTPPELVEPPLINHGKDFGRVIYNLFLLAIGKYPGVSGISVTQAPVVGTERTVSTLKYEVDGSVPAGARSIQFGLPSTFEGTINGVFFTGEEFSGVPYVAPDGDTLPEISFTLEAGYLIVVAIS